MLPATNTSRTKKNNFNFIKPSLEK